ncbi:MAG: hypothetical protein FJX77_01460 [Armatimonadetes bacterium]|nr:hypothetical protein [Armatimonadota bacterium]
MRHNPLGALGRIAARAARRETLATPVEQGRAMASTDAAATVGTVDPTTGEVVLVSLFDRDSFGETLGAPQDGWVLG